jgi:dTDP-4-dehydrorhamnose reductase
VHIYPDIERITEVSRGLIDSGRPKRTEYYVNYQLQAIDDRLTIMAGMREEKQTTPGQLVQANPPWFVAPDFALENIPESQWQMFGLSALFSRPRVSRGDSQMAGFSFEVVPNVNVYGSYSQSYVPTSVRFLGGDYNPWEACDTSQTGGLVNGEYAGKLALVTKELGARFVHISTDYVFDGSSDAPYQPDHRTNPQSAYGRSKLAGEIAVQESGADYQIFRTAWLYGANGPCFPKTVQRVLGQAGSMKVVADQIGQPTWTLDLAKLIIAHSKLDQAARPRIVHGTASGQASWFDFACEIARSLGHNSEKVVQPIATADYPTPAKRPAYSVLDNQNETGLVIADWRERWQAAVRLVLGE